MYTWMGSTPWFVEIVNVAVPFGQVAIGLGLIVGLLTRLAAFFGALVMFLFYFGNRSVERRSTQWTEPRRFRTATAGRRGRRK